MSDSEDSLGALLEAEFAALTDEETVVEEPSPRQATALACRPPATRRLPPLPPATSGPTPAACSLPASLQWRAGSQEGQAGCGRCTWPRCCRCCRICVPAPPWLYGRHLHPLRRTQRRGS